jgi:chemotaxis regulatin CheY-phosphate phosphatase CheZ
VRIAPAVLHETLSAAIFRTGDDPLDELLEVSRQKFLDRSLDIRRESVEKLWDAWERLKTVEPGNDKKAQTTALLNKAATEPRFRERLETEAKELTDIGNRFMIRHTETDKIQIIDSAHIDYLFQRMFSLMRLLLKASGRGG